MEGAEGGGGAGDVEEEKEGPRERGRRVSWPQVIDESVDKEEMEGKDDLAALVLLPGGCLLLPPPVSSWWCRSPPARMPAPAPAPVATADASCACPDFFRIRWMPSLVVLVMPAVVLLPRPLSAQRKEGRCTPFLRNGRGGGCRCAPSLCNGRGGVAVAHPSVCNGR